MKVIPAYTLIILCMLFIVLHSCLISEHDRREQFSINLRWIKGFDGESSDNMMTGLAWNLSFLGAKVPAGSMKAAVHWTNQSVFSLNLSEVVFPKKVEVTIVSILNDLKRSDEYARHGSFDLGRFIALLLTSSNYYYAITDVPRTYKEFRLQFTFSDTLAAIVESGIAHGNRLIEISESKTLNDIAFIAHEGKGSLQNQSFRASEFEVFDFMANGQLRFAIYDSTGQLKSSGNPRITDAGKPAKCLWCHEIGIHLPFFSKTNLKGYYSIDQFSKKVKEKLALVSSSRNSLKSDIDFTKDQDHTKAELLYVTFMEPSAERLAQEWGITVAEVRSKTQGIPTHGNKEFKFLPAELYHRKEIDHFSPYSVVRVADDAREKSVFEPDLKW